MRLTVAYSTQSRCFVALHAEDVKQLFTGQTASRHFCRTLQLRQSHAGGEEAETRSSASLFVGWDGDVHLARGILEVAREFAECLGLAEDDVVEASAWGDEVIAQSVMVQPKNSDDWEVVESRASYVEENLLAQIAVLTPGMAFPVWFHGQMPIKMIVDPADENRGPCFLLGRESELIVETKQRADAATRSVSVFGGSKDAENRAEERERSLQARIWCFLPDLDAPKGFLNPLDLERLLGYVEPEGCLAWLAVPMVAPDSRHPASATNGDTNHVGNNRSQKGAPPVNSSTRSDAVLLKLEPCDDVPRWHVMLGACVETHMQVPRFSYARLWRCRQVPVYVPHIELVPLNSCSWKTHASDDARWLSRLFERLVEKHGELDIMDGACLQLRDSSVALAEAQATDGSLEGASQNQPRPISARSLRSGSEVTDLYDGLSDIDDIYGSSMTKCEITNDGLGIYEVDLGLDELDDDLETERIGISKRSRVDSQSSMLPRPDLVPILIRFELGMKRLASIMPPFVRLTSHSFLDMKVTVAWPDEEAERVAGRRASHPLAALWTSTPGLGQFPEESWTEVLQALPGQISSEASPLDELPLFCEPAAQLRRHLRAQLGCGLVDIEANLTKPSISNAAAPGVAVVLGSRGTGKTTLCRRICNQFVDEGVFCLEVACGKLGQPTRKFKAVQDWLHGILRFACWHSPAIILFDDFGALCPDVEQGAQNLSITEERSLLIAEMILDMLPEVRAGGGRLALVATLPDDAAVHRTLWRALALERKISLRPPLMKERPEMLQLLCRQKACDKAWDVDNALLAEGALDEWGGRVDGFSIADLEMLVQRACIEATVETSAGLLQGSEAALWTDKRRLLARHLERAYENFTPATMADQSFFTSDVRWSDIGGLEGPKQDLLDMLTRPTKYGVLVDRAPVRTRKGLMLVGPPGCGKTMLVQAAANETKGLLRFLTVKGPELLSKYIGASEAGVRQKFEQAAAAAPCVVFFDEIEALAPKRGADSTGVTDRVVNQMLCYLDGVEDRGRVYVVAATSRPDLVDQALMRPGRFDKICYCGLPTTDEKIQTCELLATKHGLVLSASEQQEGGVDLLLHLKRLVSKFPRLFTSADIGALFSSAKIDVVTSMLQDKTSRTLNGSSKAPVMHMAHLYAALSSAKASISEADDLRYTRVFAPYRPGAQQSALQRDGSEVSSGTKVALA